MSAGTLATGAIQRSFATQRSSWSRRSRPSAVSLYAPDAVAEGRASGMTLEGRTAIRGFWEDMTVAYEEFEVQREETLDLGNGVAFGVTRASGRPVGSTGRVENRVVIVAVWEEGLIVRITMCTDIDKARAAAVRLAEERV